MMNIIKAEFSRLFKNKIFYILVGASSVWGFFLPAAVYFSCKATNDFELAFADNGIFSMIFFCGLLAAIFISLFTGTEYSDGTIRNKLVCGHTRTQVYLSELLVNFLAMMIIYVGYLSAFYMSGAIFLDKYQYTAFQIFVGVSVCVVNFFAYAAIFTGISLCKSNKAGVAVFSIVAVLLLIVGASVILDRLAEPEIFPAEVYMSADGVLMEQPEEKNQNYVSGTKRVVYQYIADILPSGQGIQSSGISTEPVVKPEFIIYSLIVALFATIIALPSFKKKNIN